MVKNPPEMRETWVGSLDWEDLLEKGAATHFSILAWRISLTEEPSRLQSVGSQRIGHYWELSLLNLLSWFISSQVNKIQSQLLNRFYFSIATWMPTSDPSYDFLTASFLDRCQQPLLAPLLDCKRQTPKAPRYPNSAGSRQNELRPSPQWFGVHTLDREC